MITGLGNVRASSDDVGLPRSCVGHRRQLMVLAQKFP